MLDDLFWELNASPVAWSPFWGPMDKQIEIFDQKIFIFFSCTFFSFFFGYQKPGSGSRLQDQMQDHQGTQTARRVRREQAHYVGVTTLEKLDQSPLIKHPETDVSRARSKTLASCVAGGHSTKELANQILIWTFGTSKGLFKFIPSRPICTHTGHLLTPCAPPPSLARDMPGQLCLYLDPILGGEGRGGGGPPWKGAFTAQNRTVKYFSFTSIAE